MSASEENSKRIVGRATRAVEAGFTLLEIMVVLAIIALLAGGVGTAVFKQYRSAQRKTAMLRVKAVRDASAQFMMDNSNNCPRSVDDLVAQKYLDKANAKDTWGSPIILRCGDQPMFVGKMGRKGNNIAIRVDHRRRPENAQS